jgi:hypothetical protein
LVFKYKNKKIRKGRQELVKEEKEEVEMKLGGGYDKATAKKAIAMVKPSIVMNMKLGVFKRECISICILSLDGTVLHQEDIKLKKEEWTHDFRSIALSKAEVSYRIKADSALLSARMPWKRKSGDTNYPGGKYYKGIAVGVSGVESWFDEMIANWVISAIVALSYEKEEKIKEEMKAKNLDFTP